MARGFESKDVEQQQQDMLERRAAAKKLEKNAEQVKRERQRDSLVLQRTRMVREIEQSTNDRHRATLQNGLTFLEQQIAALD